MGSKFLLAISCSLFFLSKAWADSSLSGLQWTGNAEFYEQASPQAHSSSNSPPYLEGRVFDADSGQMILNLLELTIEKRIREVSLRMDLGFGPVADAMAGNGSLKDGQPSAENSTEPTRNLLQAFLSYAPDWNPNLTVTAGKFYSPFGFESGLAKDNWQFSRSLSYNYAIPYWHEGVSAQYAWSPGQYSSTLMIVNGWDGRISRPTSRSPNWILNFQAAPWEGTSVTYSFMTGLGSSDPASRRQVHEVSLSQRFAPELQLATDFVYGEEDHALTSSGDSARWSAVDFYLKYSPFPWLFVSPRYEQFVDRDQGFALSGFAPAGGVGQTLRSLTLTGGFSLNENLELRLEYRLDRSDSDRFYKDRNGAGVQRQESYTLALLGRI